MDFIVLIVASVVMFVTGTCGLVGNVLTTRAVHHSQNDKSTFYAMFLLLTISGSLQVVQVLGLQVYDITAARVHKVVVVSAIINCTGSIVLLTVAVLAVNRYLSVRKKVRFCLSNMCQMVLASLAVAVGCLITTPWASFIVPTSQCADEVAVISEVFSYMCGLVIVTLTAVVTCAMSKCIIKADTAVADLQSQRNTGIPKRINFRQNIRCGKAMRWLIFEELFAYTCLSSFMLVSLVHFRSCRVTISDWWWYRLLQIISVSSKPLLLTLVSKHFRRAVLASNVLQDTEEQFRNPFNFEEDCFNMDISHVVVCRTDNESTVGATSIDSNHLANVSNMDAISLVTVTTIQEMKYPFPASVPSSNATDSDKQDTSARNSPDLRPEAASMATINISPPVLDEDVTGNNSSLSSGEHGSKESTPSSTDRPGTAVSNKKVSQKQKLSREVAEKMSHSNNLKGSESYDHVDSITLGSVLCPSSPQQLLDDVLDQRRDSGLETLPCPNVSSLPPLVSQTVPRLLHLQMIQAIPDIVLTDDEQVSSSVLEINASPFFFERSMEVNQSCDENPTNVEKIQSAHKWLSDEESDVLMHDTCNVVDGIDLLPDGHFFRMKSKQRRYSLDTPCNVNRSHTNQKSLTESNEEEGTRRLRSLNACSAIYNDHADSNEIGHARSHVISGSRPKLPPIQRDRVSSMSQDSVNTSLAMYDSDSHVYLGPLHRH